MRWFKTFTFCGVLYLLGLKASKETRARLWSTQGTLFHTGIDQGTRLAVRGCLAGSHQGCQLHAAGTDWRTDPCAGLCDSQRMLVGSWKNACICLRPGIETCWILRLCWRSRGLENSSLSTLCRRLVPNCSCSIVFFQLNLLSHRRGRTPAPSK